MIHLAQFCSCGSKSHFSQASATKIESARWNKILVKALPLRLQVWMHQKASWSICEEIQFAVFIAHTESFQKMVQQALEVLGTFLEVPQGQNYFSWCQNIFILKKNLDINFSIFVGYHIFWYMYTLCNVQIRVNTPISSNISLWWKHSKCFHLAFLKYIILYCYL
jgi:hypothetical protein